VSGTKMRIASYYPLMHAVIPERDKSLLLSRLEASQMLGISIRLLERMIREGKIPSRLLGRRRLIPRRFVENFVRGMEE
jgi:excisionase family DNA binding protein